MRAISAFTLDAGKSTRAWRAVTALRIRVSMSAIGSVISALSYRPSSSRQARCTWHQPLAPKHLAPTLWRQGTHWHPWHLRSLPAALRDACDISRERELAEAETAQCELPHVRPWAATAAATVVLPDL